MTLGFISNNESLILLKMSLYYNENAFGQHQGYRDFKNSLIFESNILQDPNIKDFSSLSKLLGLVVINNTDMFESLDAGRVTFNLSVSTNRGVRIIIAVLKDILRELELFSGIKINGIWVTKINFKNDKIIFWTGDQVFETRICLDGDVLKFAIE